jgi:outer membrane protein assembly factor BamB
MKRALYYVVIIIVAPLLAIAQPTVVSLTPARNALSIDKNTFITVTFSTNIDQSTINNSTIKINGSISGPHKATFNYNASTQTLTITPASSFKVGEVVTTTLTHGIKSVLGDSLMWGYTWSFSVQSYVNSSGKFLQSSIISVGTGLSLSTTGDFNGDGYLDLAIVNSDTLSIFLNNGNGSFTLSSRIIGVGARSLVTGDFNGDGYIDIATAAGDLVSILLNNGNGTFTLSSAMFVGNNPSITTGDFNGDGYLDLAVASMSSGTVSILLNNGSGTFVQSSIDSVGVDPRSITAGDFNGDGYLDLAVANQHSNTVSILLNDGSGKFTQSSTPATGNIPFFVTAGDFNGDGCLDLAVANNDANTVSILLNNGDGTFKGSSTVNVGNQPYSIITEDFNGDGYLDLAVPNMASNTVSILSNNGGGTFTQTTTSSAGSEPYSVTSGDFNGDGALDLAVTNYASNSVSILLNRPHSASMSLSSDSLALSGIAAGNSKGTYLKITNISVDSSLVISNISISNPVFTLNRPTLSIPTGGLDSLLVTFSPSVAGVTYNDSLIFTNNDPQKPAVKVYVKATSFPPTPTLISPANGAMGIPINTTFNWNAATGATSYHLQVSKDSTFNTLLFNDSTITTNSKQVSSLAYYTVYYWRVSALNIGGSSTFSAFWSFTTTIAPPTNLLATPQNKSIALSWTASASSNILRYRIYRGNASLAVALLDSTTGITYSDSGLTNGKRYYYRVSVVSTDLIESAFSNEVNTQPYNQPPHAVKLSDVNQPSAGRILKATLQFTSQGSTDADGTIDSVFWFINRNLISKQQSISYDFGQGTNKVMLVVKDNDGATDTSLATVTRSKFIFAMNGPVYAGPSLLGNNVLYVIGTGDAVYRLDSTGNDLYSLEVGGDVKSSTSISSDTTVYIASSDKNLYAFSKFGTSRWPALPLGGTMTSTPAVDSITNSLYVGVSNKNFFAVNRTTGAIVWNYFVDAPIVGSAAITLDRKLVVATAKGTVYGFDLNNLSSSPSPSWQISLSDSIFGSPAIDGAGNIYYCTGSGKVDKITMPMNQQATTVWQTQAGGSITGSPVIDGNGTLYVGSADGKLYAIDIQGGSIKWSYPSGAPIFSTPTVSNVDMIYFGNHGGEVFAIDTSEILHWYYQDSTSVDAPLLYNNGVLYAGTIGGRLIAFYDDADSSIRGSSKTARLSKANGTPKVPVWGTFQGNNQRTGAPAGKMVTVVASKTNQIPSVYSLSQNFPNPFNPSTTISYAIPTRSHVTLSVFNTLGQKVSELVNAEKEPGVYSVTFDASSSASGVYFYRIQAGNFVQTKKLVVVK